jgi:bloom syndrome protein
MAQGMAPVSVSALYETVKAAYPRLVPYQLKDKQLKVLEELLSGKDVVGILPTGYGKTLIFALFPLMFDMVSTCCIYLT